MSPGLGMVLGGAIVLLGLALAWLVATDRLTPRGALEWGLGLLAALGGLSVLLGRRRPSPAPRPSAEPDRRLAERITSQTLEEREAARTEREDLEADPEAPVAGRLSGALGATRRRRP